MNVGYLSFIFTFFFFGLLELLEAFNGSRSAFTTRQD